jgi:iron complex transport system permease protein
MVAAGVSDVGAVALARSFRLPSKALVAAASMLVVVAVTSVSTGAAGLPVSGVLLELADRLPFITVDSGLDARQATILTQLRLPRVVLGGLVGSSLALAGAGYQGIFRNPLADPFLLGIAAGAGFGATVGLVYDLGFGLGPLGAVQLLAFAGALLAVGIAMLIGNAAPSQTASLLLAGIATASFFTALQTFLLNRNTDTQRSILSWLFGTLIAADWGRVGLLSFYLAMCGSVLFLLRRHLDVLRIGEAESAALGIQPARVRMLVLVAASLLTAAAVSVSGLIAFVGLVVPHAVRLMVGSSYRTVVPLSAIGGATFLIAADWLSRTIVAPSELGIGVITAFVGAPFFAVLLWRTKAGML